METPDSDLGGLDRRLLAYFTDILIIYGGILATQSGLYLLTAGFPFDRLETGYQIEAWVLLTVSLPTWVYFTWSEGGHRGATLGKRLFRLKVTDLHGKPPGRGRALLRTGVKLLPWELTHLTVLTPTPWWADSAPGFRAGLVLVYLLLGAYMLTMIFHPQKRGPQDLLAGTLVWTSTGIPSPKPGSAPEMESP
jgi:uncharacterized RDD family membrane protein YckC